MDVFDPMCIPVGPFLLSCGLWEKLRKHSLFQIILFLKSTDNNLCPSVWPSYLQKFLCPSKSLNLLLVLVSYLLIGAHDTYCTYHRVIVGIR